MVIFEVTRRNLQHLISRHFKRLCYARDKFPTYSRVWMDCRLVPKALQTCIYITRMPWILVKLEAVFLRPNESNVYMHDIQIHTTRRENYMCMNNFICYFVQNSYCETKYINLFSCDLPKWTAARSITKSESNIQ